MISHEDRERMVQGRWLRTISRFQVTYGERGDTKVVGTIISRIYERIENREAPLYYQRDLRKNSQSEIKF